MNPKKIAYLGPAKTNTHRAAQKRFGKTAKYTSAKDIEAVFQAVERQRVDFGVIPVENSLEGSVSYTLDRFIDFKESPVRIVGEIEEPIQHYLITRTKDRNADLKTVCSHPQALAQCREWLDEKLPHVVRKEAASTARAVQLLTKAGIAAIGRKELADGKRLKAQRIQVHNNNRTRFLVIALQPAKKAKDNKTSLMFALQHKPGALYKALQAFGKQKINLAKIESRPARQEAWEYVFFVDIEGHVDQLKVKRALKTLEAQSVWLKRLGSYPIAKRSSR